MHAVRFLAVVLAATLGLTGCVSAWMTQTGKAVIRPSSREEAVRHYGAPIAQGSLAKDDPVQGRWRLDLYGKPDPLVRYELYAYTGLMRDEDFGGAAATANAVTLGASEAITLPFAVVNRVAGAGRRHVFLLGYNGAGKVTEFREVDEETVRRLGQ